MRTILIAGATSMIGKACAGLFDAPGNTLVLIGRNEKSLQELSQSLKVPCKTYVCDLGQLHHIEQVMSKVLNLHEQIDVFIHNVSVYPFDSIEQLSFEDWDATNKIGLGSAFAMTRALIPLFKRQQSGKIIYISSITGEHIGLKGMSAYATVKAGLNGFMRTCALELAEYKINVNSISPGKVYDVDTLTFDQQKEKLSNVPLKTFIDPMDIANMAEFLASEKARTITGQNIVIDAGQTVS